MKRFTTKNFLAAIGGLFLTILLMGAADNVSELGLGVATNVSVKSQSVSSSGVLNTSLGGIVLGDTSGGAVTTDLPAAASNTDLMLVFKKTSSDSNTWTIDGNLSETIDGALTFIMTNQFESLKILSDGTNWVIIEKINFDLNKTTKLDATTTAGLSLRDSSASTALFVEDGGNIGIGTTIPTSQLTISGAVGLKLEATENDSDVEVFQVNTDSTSGNLKMFNAGIQTIQLLSSSAAASYINTGANFGIGTSSPDNPLDVECNACGAVVAVVDVDTTITGGNIGVFYGFDNDADSNATGGFFAVFSDGSTIGSITAASATTVAFNTTSDKRLKSDIKPLTNGLEIVREIEPRKFLWKENRSEDIGFIAQELYKVYPSIVTVGGDDVDTNPWQVDYGKLTPVLTASIKELDRKVKDQEQEIKSLENRVNTLQNFICSLYQEDFCN